MKIFKLIFIVVFSVTISVLGKENEKPKDPVKIPEMFSHWGSVTTFIEIDPALTKTNNRIPDEIEEEIANLQMLGQPVVITTKDYKYDRYKTESSFKVHYSSRYTFINYI